jgi:hypothetical protein
MRAVDIERVEGFRTEGHCVRETRAPAGRQNIYTKAVYNESKVNCQRTDVGAAGRTVVASRSAAVVPMAALVMKAV